jgi:hypothetical protein
MTSNQNAPDQAEEPEAEQSEEYAFEYTLPGAGRPIHLRKPNDAQMAVLLRLESMLEDSPVAGVQLYMDSLGALMPDADEQWCMRALLRGKVELDDFADIGRQTLFHYYPELKKQAEERERTSKQHGPTATRRPRRR